MTPRMDNKKDFRAAVHRLAAKISHVLGNSKSRSMRLRIQTGQPIQLFLSTLFGWFELPGIEPGLATETVAYFMDLCDHVEVSRDPFWRSVALPCGAGIHLPVALHWQPQGAEALLDIFPLRKENFHRPLAGWPMAEADRERLQRQLKQRRGISLFVCAERVHVLPFIYSCLAYLAEQGTNVLALEQIAPVSVSAWRREELESIQHIHEWDPSLTVAAEYDAVFVEADPLVFFDTTAQLTTIAKNSHLLLLFAATDPGACFEAMIARHFLSREIMEQVNLMVRLTPIKELCSACRTPISIDAPMQWALGLSEDEAAGLKAYASAGCKLCRQTGFYGFVPLFHIHDFSTFSSRYLAMFTANAGELSRFLPKNHARRFGLELVTQGRIQLKDLLEQLT